MRDAVDKGARVVAGGHRSDDGGHFYEPTLLLDVDHSMDAMREETFGPTLPIMKVADADEGVRLSNDSPYGLAASVWTKDVAKGERLARRIEAGAVTVNDAQINYVALELPMGGWKSSGTRARATARTGSASTRRSRRSWSRAWRRSATSTCCPTRPSAPS